MGSSFNLKRFFDIFFSISIIVFLWWLYVAVYLVVKITSRGPALYWSERVGRSGILFKMPKFRTMWIETPEVASHLLREPEATLTPVGSFLRRSSLDEIPQFFCVLKGSMSMIGPRPALHNQFDLIELRKKSGIDSLLPGITGYAQINGRDNLSIVEKVKLDKFYLDRRSAWFDIKIFFLTAAKIFRSREVSH